MAKKKRSTLPKDFREILERGDIQEIRSVFESCDVNAVGGYGKETAIAFDKIPDETVQWLVANGADLSARNTWGRSALHVRAGSRRSTIAVLLELGANVSVTDSYGNTPLHSAANSHNTESAMLLLRHGAKASAMNNDGLTPIELSLKNCQNIDIQDTVKLVRVLLESGAKKSERCKTYVDSIGRIFEFHREGFDKDSVEAVSSSLNQLYEIFGVSPIPRRLKYDGKSPIVARASPWQKQHEELWDLLVPSSGQASTVQGELIRISGRISNEIEGNGGVNWDADFSRMANHFIRLLGMGVPLPPEDIEEANAIVRSIRTLDGYSSRLAQLAVLWVGKNPTPTALGNIDYKR
ncbi:MAG TPA: ankyrin repeat domain-containing protein [Chitinolyticbacter sp.]|nr:ankyrin repeat domain-containing protein [Chitinolyticbacter sp.]